MGSRAQNIIIVAVAALAVAASALGLVRFQRASEAGEYSLPAAQTTQDTGRSGGGDDEVATTEPGDGDAATATVAVAPEVNAEQAWLDALAQPGAQLLVVGDHTVNNVDEWVTEWAALQGRTVDVVFWHEESDARYEQRVRFGDDGRVTEEGDDAGEVADLVIWNAGREGTSLGEAAERVAAFVEEGADPDLAILTLAAEGGPEDLDTLLSGLEDAAGGPVPTAVVLSPPGWANADLVQVLADWAAEQELPVVDLFRTMQTAQPTPYATAEAVQEQLEVWAER